MMTMTFDYPWFIDRMMNDTWSFGLLLVTGQMVHIETIYAVKESMGEVWLDVAVSDQDPLQNKLAFKFITSPTSRTKATINASHVVMAIELADT